MVVQRRIVWSVVLDANKLASRVAGVGYWIVASITVSSDVWSHGPMGANY